MFELDDGLHGHANLGAPRPTAGERVELSRVALLLSGEPTCPPGTRCALRPPANTIAYARGRSSLVGRSRPSRSRHRRSCRHRHPCPTASLVLLPNGHTSTARSRQSAAAPSLSCRPDAHEAGRSAACFLRCVRVCSILVQYQHSGSRATTPNEQNVCESVI